VLKKDLTGPTLLEISGNAFYRDLKDTSPNSLGYNPATYVARSRL